GGLPGRDPKALLRRADPPGAPRLRGTSRPLADDEGVRRRRGDDRPSADRDRALRQLERRETPRRPRAPPLRDAGGAPSPAARARRRARARAAAAGPRREPRPRRVEVALLADVRLAHARAPRGGFRRAGGGGAAG